MRLPRSNARALTAFYYVRMVLSLVAGLGLLVTAVVLFVAGQPAGVAALMFGVIFTGLGVFNVWLVVLLRRAAKQQPASDFPESA